ncbi:MAG: hypothetical protein AB8C84_05920 [Oligoflexales bacterium]
MHHVLLMLLLSVPVQALADQYHYSNVLIGDRAIGLGGAFVGVSDDASGVFYNPAGLAFALSNDISGSANALYSRTVTYKGTIAGKDFVEESGGSLPSFFGGLNKLDHIEKGLVFAFGIMTLDGEQKEQNDLIKENEAQVLSSRTCDDGTSGSNLLHRYHRVVNQKATTSLYAAGAGYRISNNFSLGFGLNYYGIDELTQVYQDVSQSESCTNNYTRRALNVRESLSAMAIQPVFGAQYVFGDVALGLTAKIGGAYVSQLYDVATEGLNLQLVSADNTSVEEANGGMIPTKSTAGIQRTLIESESSNPLGSKYPDELRAGVAWFGSTRLLVTTDVILTTASKGEKEGVFAAVQDGGAAKDRYYYERNQVLNAAAGMEYYVVPAVPVRVGIFTNNDARPEVSEQYAGQNDHVDYSGASLFASWVQPNSQIGAGVVFQQGSGKAQKLGDSVIQDIEAVSSTFAFSATHSF